MDTELTMEQAFGRLQALLDRLDREELTLEENFRLYEEGLKLVQTCHDRLDTMEKKLQILENGEA